MHAFLVLYSVLFLRVSVGLISADARSLLALIAFDRHRVRHVAVRPDRWRHSLARRAFELAVARMTRPCLWVLVDNRRARGLYDHLGWRPTGREQRAEFAPYPAEIELALVR